MNVFVHVMLSDDVKLLIDIFNWLLFRIFCFTYLIFKEY